MSRLARVKRPHQSLINAVESVGILLGIDATLVKSIYKAKSPSNYDVTVEYLQDNFSEAMTRLALLNTNGISNLMASDLYRKIRSCPFDYEAAVNSGGLEAREMFNILVHIIDKLVADKHRIPITQTSVLTIVDGSRPSYVALDIVSHIHQHGTCIIGALTYEDDAASEASAHLVLDLNRRCKDLYKMEDGTFQVVPIICTDMSDIVQRIENLYDDNRCGVLTMGIDTTNAKEDELAFAVTYSAWKLPHRIILAKSFARVCDFGNVSSPRKFQIAIKNEKDLDSVFADTLPIINPGDAIVLMGIVETGDPIGDVRDTRYDFGDRYDQWVSSRAIAKEIVPDKPGWNNEANASLRERMEFLLINSQIAGVSIITTRNPVKTVAQTICEVAFEHQVDVLVIRRGENREVSRECLQRAHCNVMLTS